MVGGWVVERNDRRLLAEEPEASHREAKRNCVLQKINTSFKFQFYLLWLFGLEILLKIMTKNIRYNCAKFFSLCSILKFNLYSKYKHTSGATFSTLPFLLYLTLRLTLALVMGPGGR